MNMKKPAQLNDSLLSIRPRKGEAKPQTEQEAALPKSSAEASVETTPSTSAPRRRRRLSDKKMQLNLRVDEKSLERFTNIADEEGLIFGDLFKKLLDSYKSK